jgi:hypothetical protein
LFSASSTFFLSIPLTRSYYSAGYINNFRIPGSRNNPE